MRVQVNGVVQPILVRGFCDTGSQVNLISENCVQLFRMYKYTVNVPVTSVAANTVIKSKVCLTIMHRLKDDIQVPIEALVVPRIGGSFPDQFMEQCKLPTADLADPTFHIPSSVDLLLGAGVWASIILPTIERLPSLSLVAQSTTLGFVIYGQAKQVITGVKSYRLTLTDGTEENLDQLLESYWNADEMPQPRKWTTEEEAVEANFVNSHKRDNCGRYVVTIPRKKDYASMGNSFNLAKACFLSVERKMERNPPLKAKYREVMDDYRRSGHMIVAPPHFGEDHLVYYMPHHPINFDPMKAKGKFRVVFNASAPSANGVSFNDQQMPGPKLQSDLIETFLRFRLRRYAMTADIKQMFRQVNVAQSEYNYQRILWRDEPNQRIQQYFITVVSWGMTSAGFNAVRVLRQCALDGREEFPLGADVALNDFYFDDMLSGAHSETDLIKRQYQVTRLLGSAGLELTKLCTNSKLLSNEFKDTEFPLECGLLGMKWLTKEDLLRLNTTKFSPLDCKITKRAVISAIAKIYDPSGLVLPVIVTGKIIQQNIWRANLDWDATLPAELQDEWTNYERNVLSLANIKIPRWIGMVPGNILELHIFSDSSELAMGACAYLVSRGQDLVTTHLITSRSKVAPIKRVTIPRLELSAAVIAAKLGQFVRMALKLDDLQTYFWTDSMITCHWINKNPLSLTPYIANRVTVILELTSNTQWRHIPGNSNPADLLTRGASVQEISDSDLWWHGPHWLKLSTSEWPDQPANIMNLVDPEQPSTNEMDACATAKSKSKRVIAFFCKTTIPSISILTSKGQVQSLLNKHSNIDSLLRVTALVLRFISCIKIKNRDRKFHASPAHVPPITSTERKSALKFWIKHTQALFYCKEIE